MVKQRLSVGLADLARFAPLVTALGWERMIQALDVSFQAVGEIVVGQNGRIVKYLGDAVLFTCDDAVRAARAARAIAGYRGAAGPHTVHFHVAVTTGEVWTACLGHRSHVSDDIFGDPVNRVFRLLAQARADPDGIALDDETRAAAGLERR